MREKLVFVSLQPQDMTPESLIDLLEALQDMICSEINETPIQCVVFYFRGEATYALPLAGKMEIQAAMAVASCIIANALPDSCFETDYPSIKEHTDLAARSLFATYLELASNIN